MAIKNKRGKYACFYCEKEYKISLEADTCRDSHDLIYIAMSRSDANKLLNYIYIPDPRILKDTNFVKFIRKALRKKHRNEEKTV